MTQGIGVYHAEDPRAVRDEQDDRVLDREGGARARLRPEGRARRGHAAIGRVGARARWPAVNLVTGGAGYFGTVLVDKLVAAGEPVRIFDINDAADRPAGVEMVHGDIRDAAAVAPCVRRRRRSFTTTSRWFRSRRTRTRSGASTTTAPRTCSRPRSPQVCRRSSTCRRARCSARPIENPVDDDTPPRPQEDYGRAKLAAESAVPRRTRRAASTSRSSGRARSWATAVSASCRSCSSGSARATTSRCSAAATTSTSSSTPTISRAACARPPRSVRAPATYNVGAERVRHDARDARGARRPRRHRQPRRLGAGVACRRDDERDEPARPVAARRVSRADVRRDRCTST